MSEDRLVGGFSKVEILLRILGVGYNTAKEILNGERPMTLDQEVRLEEYNKDVGPEYRIYVKK